MPRELIEIEETTKEEIQEMLRNNLESEYKAKSKYDTAGVSTNDARIDL